LSVVSLLMKNMHELFMSGKRSFLVGTLEGSGTSDTVHARPIVQKEVLNRIVELKNSGMGYRKISEQLKKERLATLSKSSIAKLYHEKAIPLVREAEKELGNDEEYRVLSEKESKLQKEVDRAKTIEEARKSIRRLLLEKARTSEGIQDIFNNAGKILEFAQATVDYRSLVFKNVRVFDLFNSYCQAHNLPLAETLFKAVGRLDEYKADADEDGTLLDLDNYIGVQLDNFLIDIQEQRRKMTLQKKFLKNLINAMCPKCGKPICSSVAHLGYPEAYTFLTIGGQLRCYHCNTPLQATCPGCDTPLNCKARSFWCRNCNLTFHLQDIKN
jgi:hypothetical protein